MTAGAPIGAAQRLIFPATSDASGNITFTIPAPGRGLVVTGTLNIPLAPLGASFTVYNGVGGVAIYNFQSDNPFGSIQQRELLQVKGTGLTANTAYNLIFTGYQTDEAHAPVPPTPYGSRTTINNSTSNPVTIVTPTPPSSFVYTNEITIASTGVAQQLGNFPLTVGLALYAKKANAAIVRVGGSSVSSSSFGLEPGVGVTFPISNTNIVWLEGTSGDIVEGLGQ